MRMIIAMFLVMIGTSCLQAQPAKDTADFVVLELFTSEGCASCPPAELLMEKVQREYAGKNVYVLCYHVDYFNRQGWRDPYSDAAYSRRQEMYDTLFNHEVYTPQLVINGGRQTKGYDASAVYGAIRKLEKSTAKMPGIQASAMAVGSKIRVSYTLKGSYPGQLLRIVLVQKEGGQKVTAGENAGRKLHHVQIVRAVATAAARDGSLDMELPEGTDPASAELVFLVQPLHGGLVSAAAACAIGAG
ncbi:DUF1223 domain-containing protein [Compostibacter hankyongensis]|uniref:DUF1223 domain-containing protein n=1 Tax=Compostibacter hankyongensis TaxID=1007089 RepID=A0ABP8G914_9BACT